MCIHTLRGAIMHSARAARTGIKSEHRRTDEEKRRMLTSCWEPVPRAPIDPLDPTRGHLKGLKTVRHPSYPCILSVLPLRPPPPTVLALASVQTTNHIDGFVFNSLSTLPASAAASLPPAAWVTSRNPGPKSPKEMFWKMASAAKPD